VLFGDISFSQLLSGSRQGKVRDVVIPGPDIHGTFTKVFELPDLRANDP